MSIYTLMCPRHLFLTLLKPDNFRIVETKRDKIEYLSGEVLLTIPETSEGAKRVWIPILIHLEGRGELFVRESSYGSFASFDIIIDSLSLENQLVLKILGLRYLIHLAKYKELNNSPQEITVPYLDSERIIYSQINFSKAGPLASINDDVNAFRFVRESKIVVSAPADPELVVDLNYKGQPCDIQNLMRAAPGQKKFFSILNFSPCGNSRKFIKPKAIITFLILNSLSTSGIDSQGVAKIMQKTANEENYIKENIAVEEVSPDSVEKKIDEQKN